MLRVARASMMQSADTGLGLPDDSLEPDYAGIRPKLGTREKPIADFVISGPAEHGVRGLVNLFGIESPGPHIVPCHRTICAERPSIG